MGLPPVENRCETFCRVNKRTILTLMFSIFNGYFYFQLKVKGKNECLLNSASSVRTA